MKEKLNCILLIDDDEASNFLSHLILEEVNCALHIKTQQTAKAALNYLIESSQTSNLQNTLPFPDLIFLDINMPAMDGWEFLGNYKLVKNGFPHAPVIIMLTTSDNPDDKVKALGIQEVSDIYIKPLTPEIIGTIIANYFPDYLHHQEPVVPRTK